VIQRPNLRARPQYFCRLFATGSDDGKERALNSARPHRITRMYTSGTKGGKDDKPLGATKTVEECMKEKNQSSSKQPIGKEFKPVISIHPDKATIRPPDQECGKPHMMKDTPQPDCPYDDSQRKKYTKHLIGGLLLLLASVAGFSRKMTERMEQRYCIKFCQKLGDSQSQTIRKIQQVFGEDAMGVTQIKEWFNRFKDGRTSAESEQRCGRPQTARSAAVVERVRNLVMADRRLTVREIAEEVGVSKDSAHAILRNDLNMNRVAAKFVPKLLSPEQKDLHRDVAQDLLDTANTDPGFLNTVITGDESWVYGYDPETKTQWKHPESPRPKKARQVQSKIKVMLTVFFDVRGIVHHEYAPEGQTVTKEYYHDVLRRLRDAVRRKRPDMWTANNWHLHHDNAPAHSSQLIHTFLAKYGITTVRQTPYSPDLAPCDFWLFPKLKTPLKGSRFESREDIMRNATTELNTIPKEDFQRMGRRISMMNDIWTKKRNTLLVKEVLSFCSQKCVGHQCQHLTPCLMCKAINIRYPPQNWLHLYTDGSLISREQGAGAGVTCCLFSLYRSLGYGTTSFDGEIIAISESLRNLLCHISKFKNAVILSDSKAAILSIVSKHTPSSQTAEITEMLSQLISLNKRIVFQRIPSHCGILGNENADALAKKGSTATYRPVTKSTYYSVKRFIKSAYLDLNKQYLITQSQGKKWNSLHQNPQLIPDLPRKSSVAAFRLATGHDCLAKHLHRIGIYQSPICQLCNSNQEMDSEHLKICASVAERPRVITKFPGSSKDIPSSIPYLLIGGGTASFAAFRAIKSADSTAAVLVIDNDGYYPYMRPPLSKEMWFNDNAEATKKLKFKQWNGSERSLFYEPDDFYVDCTNLKNQVNGGVAVARGWTVKKIDAYEKKAILEDGYEISYDKCLIATGSKPRNLPLFENASQKIKDRVTLFRGIFDFEELEGIVTSGAKSVAVVGGGFLGSELACALARKIRYEILLLSARSSDLRIHQIFREPGNMGKVLPEYLSAWTTNKVRDEGVNVITNAEVEDVEFIKDRLILSLNDGSKVHGHRVSYIRKGSEKVTAAHLQQAPKYPPKVMFWGCFTHEGPGALIRIKGMMNSDKYIHLLETRIVPQLQKSFPDGRGVFQQDLAPCHTSRKTTEFFNKKNIQISADQVIVAVGAQPNTELAGSSDLEVDEEYGGFLVNAELMARSNLWSAGDCTCFYDVKLGRRRVEHHDHAVVSGRLAGENMTGAGISSHSSPSVHLNSCNDSGLKRLFLTRRPSMTHTCSIGFMSGLLAGHGRTWIPTSWR
ncbi:hypothetical protein ANN_18248, partial [Periplaneta americana]